MTLDEVADYIESQGLGTVKTRGASPSWPIYQNLWPAGSTDAIFISEGPSLPPVDSMGGDVGVCEFEQVALVVQVRSSTYSVARARAQAIWGKLHKLGNVLLSGTRYLLVTARSSPFPMGRDDNGLWLVGCNYDVAKEVSP